MVTMAQATETPHTHRHAPVAAPVRLSVLRMGLPGRLAIAAGAIVALWSAIALGLS